MAKKKTEDKNIDLTGIIRPGTTDDQLIPTATPNAEQYDSLLSGEALNEITKDAVLQEEYGDQEIRTAAERAASAATFGLSDQALVKGSELLSPGSGKEMQKALRQRELQNQEAAIFGEVAGTLGPALVTGGTSLGAKALSTGARTALKAGVKTEQATAKILSKILKETGNKKAAQEVVKKSISTGAGSAVEGAAYGLGELVKEEALGNADFNAENLIAHVGPAAIIGGAAGSILGSTEALLPVIKNNKVVDVVTKKINTNIDKRVAAANLSKMKPSEVSKLRSTSWGEKVYDNLPKFYEKNLKLSIKDSAENIYKKSTEELTRLGDEIGNLAKQADEVLAARGEQITRSQVGFRVKNQLTELLDEVAEVPGAAAKRQQSIIKREINAWDEWVASPKPLKATELREMKTSLQKVAKWNKSFDALPIQGQIDRKVADAVRQEFLDIADRVSTYDNNLGETLRQLNLDYATAVQISPRLKRALDADAQKDTIGFKDLLTANLAYDFSGTLGLGTALIAAKKIAESDFRRKVTILANMERANKSIENSLTKGFKNFASGVKRGAVPVSSKVLTSSTFAQPSEDGQRRSKPKNKQEAFNEITKNLNEYVTEPEKFAEIISKSNLRITDAAPRTADQFDDTLIRAVQFLHNKLPKAPYTNSLFQREYEPSSIELSKFERYLAAVENPISVVEDLEQGILTREAVEAVRVVYPNLYTRLQDKAADTIAKNQKMPYNNRIQLGILLDIPADPSMSPENVTGLQQAYADLEQQQNAARKDGTAVATTQGGLGNINQASQEQTETQQISNRKQES